jgi:hypothetical protein
MLILVPAFAVAAVAGAAWWLHTVWTTIPRSNADFGVV